MRAALAHFAVVQNERRSLEQASVIIRVYAGSSDASDYEKSKELIKAGYLAAQAKAADLAKFELPPDEWAAYVAARKQRTRRAPGEGRIIEVQAPDISFQKSAESELIRKTGATNVTEPQLENVLSGIVAATLSSGRAGTAGAWNWSKACRTAFATSCRTARSSWNLISRLDG